jgi:hypothetical protein
MSLAILLHGWLRGQFTSHPSQEREGWGTRAFVFASEVGGWATRHPRLWVGLCMGHPPPELFGLVGSSRVGHPPREDTNN